MRAFAEVSAGGVYLPAGTYIITRVLQTFKGSLVLVGAGKDKTTLYFPKSLTDIYGNKYMEGQWCAMHSQLVIRAVAVYQGCLNSLRGHDRSYVQAAVVLMHYPRPVHTGHDHWLSYHRLSPVGLVAKAAVCNISLAAKAWQPQPGF